MDSETSSERQEGNKKELSTLGFSPVILNTETSSERQEGNKKELSTLGFSPVI